jgi:tetratricopeptide (TPR) repeat protein
VTACPDAQVLQDLVDDRLDAAARQQLLAHVDTCSSCHAVVAEVFGKDKEPATTPMPARGAQIGHFVALENLGSGSMGVVVAAYDIDLDRKVALKLIRPDATSAAPDVERRTRLLREAQALAKLSHPNVITVYEVGTFGEQVFIAMELVDGGTLGDWIHDHARSVPEIVDMFRRVGGGLAAAHAAGLVHRDFKPDNVLVGKDGRVRVTDFGLVGTPFDAPGDGATPAFAISLTRTGGVVGTPRYMAPEQHDAAPVDGRADLFAFCVALHEAVYGVPPFGGKSYQELADNVRAGRVCVPPPRVKVPKWLRRIILRGLERDPAARFPSMDALLTELERDRGRPRRIAVIAGGAALLLLGAVAVSRMGSVNCRGGEKRLAGVWDESLRSRVRGQFLGTKKPFAERAWTTVAANLDRYTGDWVAMHRSVCVASRDGEQSAQALDLRMTCLQARLGNVAALTQVLSDADTAVVEQAVSAVAALPPLDGCADLARLSGRVPPPADPKAREKIEVARRRLSDAQALHDAGKYAAALPLIAEVLPAADLPLTAEALFLRARLEDRLGDARAAENTLFSTVAAATRAGHLEVETDAQIELIDVAGVVRAEAEVGHRSVEQSSALLVRLGNDRARQARLDRYHGFLLTEEDKYEDARARFLSALALEQKLQPVTPRRIAAIFNDLGKIDHLEGKHEAALTNMRKVLAIMVEVQGDSHPDVALAHANLGSVYSGMGRLTEALDEMQKALIIQEQSMGPAHPDVATTRANRSDAYRALGRFQEALAEAQRAIDISQKMPSPHEHLAAFHFSKANSLRDLGRLKDAHEAYDQAQTIQEAKQGREDATVASILEARGHLLLTEKRFAEAFDSYDRSRAIFEKIDGPGDRRVGTLLDDMADCLFSQRRVAAAKELRKRARAILEKELPPDSPELAITYVSNGDSLQEIGDSEGAIPDLEHGVMILEKHPSNLRPLALARFSLATALWKTRRDRPRALRLAQLAQRDLASMGKDADSDRQEIDVWVSAHIR